ncbi:MAG: thioredoxin family protein [Gammaproteobacteria bacterium]|nr:thioredoxin family protein [Gammaproteobacteria bacterium]
MNNQSFASKPGWQQLLVFLLLIGLFFIIERQIQVYLGKQAIAASALPSTKFSTAVTLSRQSGKPVLANFSAIWCGACRRLERNVLANAKVHQHIMANYHYARLEYENDRPPANAANRKSDRDWFDQFGVRGFPTLLVIDGDHVRQLAPTFRIEEFLAQLETRGVGK